MDEPLRFYLDENVHTAVADQLRKRGYDAITTEEANTRGISDEGQLEFAASQSRVIVSFDDDYTRLHDAGRSHHGIAYFPGRSDVGHVVESLTLLGQTTGCYRMIDKLEFL